MSTKDTPKIVVVPGDDSDHSHASEETAKAKAEAAGKSGRAAHVAALETELDFLLHQKVPNEQRIAGVKAQLSQFSKAPTERKLETAGGSAPAKKAPAKKAAPAANES